MSIYIRYPFISSTYVVYDDDDGDDDDLYKLLYCAVEGGKFNRVVFSQSTILHLKSLLVWLYYKLRSHSLIP